ncbi:MAG: alpha/beta fold hydrolase [Gammaproteobacteria bacterium]
MTSKHLSIPFLFLAFLAVRPLDAASEAPPDGAEAVARRIDIGGFYLSVACLGKGRPTVILDHGIGSSSRDWRHVQRGLASTTRVCSYDRAGYGQSDPGPEPRTSSRIASELRTLVDRAELPPPYLLAGHSFGGYNMRAFAELYPDETAGLVLVDSPHEEQADRFFQTEAMRRLDPHGSLQYLWESEILGSLSAIDLKPFARLLGPRSASMQGIFGEIAGFAESSRELRSFSNHDKLPVVVIAHGQRVLAGGGALSDQLEDQWLSLQKELASRFKHHRFIVAEHSGHNIPLEQPDLVIDAIKRLILELRP